MASLHIDDAQSAHGQPDVLLDQKSFIVGTTMNNLLVHRSQRITRHATVTIGKKDAADSTHV